MSEARLYTSPKMSRPVFRKPELTHAISFRSVIVGPPESPGHRFPVARPQRNENVCFSSRPAALRRD
jgi:hypothetical protein